MCGKAAAALAEVNSLGWAKGDNGLMTHEDYFIHSALKVLIKEKEYYLQQGLYTCALGVLVGYYLKRIEPAI